MQFPEDKRPSTKLIWEGTPEEINDWIDRAFNRDRKHKNRQNELDFLIDERELEG